MESLQDFRDTTPPSIIHPAINITSHLSYTMSAEASSSKASKKSRKSQGGDVEAEQPATEETVEVNKNKRHRKEKREFNLLRTTICRHLPLIAWDTDDIDQ